MNIWNVKGICENCGFGYMGNIVSKDSSFPNIKCPKCNKVTENFDESYIVDKLNKEENNLIEYIESRLTTS